MNSIHPPKLLRWMDEEFDRVIELAEVLLPSGYSIPVLYALIINSPPA